MELDLTQTPEQPKQDIGVEYTNKIVDILRDKVKMSNASSEKKVTLAQLKMVFIEGARAQNADLFLGGFSRVNMFLRLYCSSSFAHEFRVQSEIKSFKSSTLDFSNYISPNTEDIRIGLEDAKAFTGVKISVDDLYLEKPVSIAHYKEYL